MGKRKGVGSAFFGIKKRGNREKRRMLWFKGGEGKDGGWGEEDGFGFGFD